MKAIRITKDNKDRLEAQFKMDQGTLERSSGLYLVAGFGNEQYEGLLTKAELINKFWATGKSLDNDFFEVTKKAGVEATPVFTG